jgi:hypothetical protein
MPDADQEARWARERAEALDRLIEGKARVIVALPSVLERRMALEQWDRGRPARIRERLEARVKVLWQERRGGRAG